MGEVAGRGQLGRIKQGQIRLNCKSNSLHDKEAVSRDGWSMQWCPSSIVYVQIVYFNDMYTSRLARALANNLLTRTRISWTTLRSQQNDIYTICEECNFKHCIHFVWLTVSLYISLLWTNTQALLCKRLIMKKLLNYNLITWLLFQNYFDPCGDVP